MPEPAAIPLRARHWRIFPGSVIVAGNLLAPLRRLGRSGCRRRASTLSSVVLVFSFGCRPALAAMMTLLATVVALVILLGSTLAAGSLAFSFVALSPW